MTGPKAEGGLGLKDLWAHADTLLSKWLLKALESPDTEWAKVICANLKLFGWDHYKLIRRNNYSVQDRILIGEVWAFQGRKYTAGSWQAWCKLRSHLLFVKGGAVIPGRWGFVILIKCLDGFTAFTPVQAARIAAIYGKA